MLTTASMKSFAATPAGTLSVMLAAPAPLFAPSTLRSVIAGSTTYGRGSFVSSRRSESHQRPPCRATDHFRPSGVMSRPPGVSTRAGSIETPDSAASWKTTVPSALRRGVRPSVRRRHRHVRSPWRRSTVRNCSVVCEPTTTVSRPNGVTRSAPCS